MIVERLDVENVRNIESAHLELHAGINLLVGDNGAGKTSLLEAIYLLIRGRSFRTRQTTGLIRHGQSRLGVGLGCRATGGGAVNLGYRRSRGGRSELRQQGVPVRHSSTVAALLPVQLLLPNLASLVFEGPLGRRQWLDWGTFHVKQSHVDDVREYRRALRHRNATLRSGDLDTLDAWNEQVAELGETVAAARQAYFEGVVGEVRASVEALSPGLSLDFSLAPGWRDGSLAEVLGRNVDRDVKSGATRSGPHQADVLIRCGEDAASEVLSRGQGKAVASALRVGQAQGLAKAGKQSLFLIDDAGAELDLAHNDRFYALLDGMACQIVATSAHADIVDALAESRDGFMFHVKHGQFERRTR